MYNIYYIENEDFKNFFACLKSDYRLFSTEEKETNFTQEKDYAFVEAKEQTEPLFNPYRAVEPLKAFFTHPKEKVAEYFSDKKEAVELKETVIFGVKSCDIAGHKIQDFVFLEGVEIDSLYKVRRDKTIFISSDCTDFKKVCHCLAWEILPHPTEGYDLNLSQLNDGYLVEVGSKKGEDLVERYKKFFSPAKDAQISARQAKRDSLIQRLKRHLLPQNLVSKTEVQKIVKQAYNADTWQNFMLTCVECGGCNLICDTCHCFLLSDQKAHSENLRIRQWDSCLYANYARVAGGANPLKTRAQRLRNRFMKKFDFFVDNLQMPACCGCGRCIEVCPGKIDIREVLKDCAKKTAAKE